MGYVEVHAAIRGRFRNSGIFSVGKIAWPNSPLPLSSPPWARLSLEPTEAKWLQLGSPGTNIERNYGMITVQIFVAAARGEETGLTLAQQVRTLFRGWTDVTTGLRIVRPPQVRFIGFDKNKWAQYNVIAYYHFDTL